MVVSDVLSHLTFYPLHDSEHDVGMIYIGISLHLHHISPLLPL